MVGSPAIRIPSHLTVTNEQFLQLVKLNPERSLSELKISEDIFIRQYCNDFWLEVLQVAVGQNACRAFASSLYCRYSVDTYLNKGRV